MITFVFNWMFVEFDWEYNMNGWIVAALLALCVIGDAVLIANVLSNA